MPEHLKGVLVPIHPKGWPFIGGALVVSILLGILGGWLMFLGLLITAWMVYFFRDPPRVTPEGPGIVTSPADGEVQAITKRRPPPRTPVPGVITRLAYKPGKFLNAALDKASEDNERQSFKIETANGATFGLVQIAGLVARRIVGFVEEGDQLHAGERIGLIRFGSRCDVYLPDGVTPLVAKGQRAVAGETVLADGRREADPSGWRRS